MMTMKSHSWAPENSAGSTTTTAPPRKLPCMRTLRNRPGSVSLGGEVNIGEEETSCRNGQEKLKRHREEVSDGGGVSVPEKWGKEELLRDWMDCASFDALLAPKGLASAREALVAEARRSSSPVAVAGTHQRLRIGRTYVYV